MPIVNQVKNGTCPESNDAGLCWEECDGDESCDGEMKCVSKID